MPQSSCALKALVLKVHRKEMYTVLQLYYKNVIHGKDPGERPSLINNYQRKVSILNEFINFLSVTSCSITQGGDHSTAYQNRNKQTVIV